MKKFKWPWVSSEHFWIDSWRIMEEEEEATMEYIFLDFPKKRVGNFRIIHEKVPKGQKIPVVSSREAIFSGKKPSYVQFDKDVVFHKLEEVGHGIWISDVPQEQASQFPYVDGMSGTVLIGGLGIGLVAKYLEKKPEIEKLVIVEKEKDIIKLVTPYLNLKKSEIICADLYDYLQKCKGVRKFDHAYYDIWSPTGEDVLYTHVRILKGLSIGVVPMSKIVCWQEDVMLGQLRLSLETIIQTKDMPRCGILTWTDEEFKHACKWQRTRVPYMRWYRKTRPNDNRARMMAEIYVNTYCDIKKWDKTWGKYEREG